MEKKPKYEITTLSNGIRLIHVTSNSDVSCCGVAVDAGSRDEDENQEGLAHFVEHLLFKGTERRNARNIIDRLEIVGGELNAYTTKEDTFVYAITLEEDLKRTMDLLSDIVLHSIFPEEEMEKEVEVIIEELESYNDTPNELIYDDFDEMIFKGSRLAHNILGKSEKLRQYRRDDVLSYYNKQYVTDGMVLFVVSRISHKKVEDWAEKLFGNTTRKKSVPDRMQLCDYQKEEKSIQRDTHQLHYMCGCRVCGIQNENYAALSLLNNIIGGPGMNSLLNLSLREHNGIAYITESNYTAYSDTGIINFYAGCDLEYEKRCSKLMQQTLDKLINKPIGAQTLKNYKRQYINQAHIDGANAENVGLALGRSVLRLGKVDSREEMGQTILGITSQKLQELADTYFRKENISILKYK